MRGFFFLLLLASSAQGTPLDQVAARFNAGAVLGTFVLYDNANDSLLIYNQHEAERGTLPASTFKVFNALVALETGVIADENEVFAWDGVERSIKAWNQDHDLSSAIRYSAVWYYQELARRIGPERMQQWIDRVGYGNRDIGGGIDRFWLDGEIRISALEQIGFLNRLAMGELPFSQDTMNRVRQITLVDQGPGWVMHGKTGWAVRDEPNVGWYVGWVDRDDRTWVFATRIEMTAPEHTALRIQLTRDILVDLGVLPEQ